MKTENKKKNIFRLNWSHVHIQLEMSSWSRTLFCFFQKYLSLKFFFWSLSFEHCNKQSHTVDIGVDASPIVSLAAQFKPK